MAQLFVNDVKFLRIFPMKRKSEAASTLIQLIQDIGIPSHIHTDGARELQYGKWRDVCQEYGIKQTITEPYSPWHNRAEVNIREAKKAIYRLMQCTLTPKPLWDYCANYMSEITCFPANDLTALHGRTPYELVTGNTLDISEYVEFQWYEPVYYYEDMPFPDPKLHLACWLGVAHRVGQTLCYWLLIANGNVIACTTIQRLPRDDLLNDTTQEAIKEFDNSI
jgi:hypothetical protein